MSYNFKIKIKQTRKIFDRIKENGLTMIFYNLGKLEDALNW